MQTYLLLTPLMSMGRSKGRGEKEGTFVKKYSSKFVTVEKVETKKRKKKKDRLKCRSLAFSVKPHRPRCIHVVDFLLYKNVKKKSEKKYEKYLHPFTHCEAYFSSSIFTIKISICGKRFGLYRSFSLTLQVRHAI